MVDTIAIELDLSVTHLGLLSRRWAQIPGQESVIRLIG